MPDFLVIAPSEWTHLDSGDFNIAYISKNQLTINGHTGYWVHKIPKMMLDNFKHYNNKKRALRIWNTLNPNYPAYETKDGWIVPYLGHTVPSDEQIAEKIRDIYYKHRRIIFDALDPDNFLVYNGEVICIDVDFAIRRGSIVSDQGLHEKMLAPFIGPFPKAIKNHTLRMIQTLRYLEFHLEKASIKDQYLSQECIKKLHVLAEAGFLISAQDIDNLLELVEFDIDNEIQDRWLVEFLSRGSITAPADNKKTHVIQLAKKYGLPFFCKRLIDYNPELARLIKQDDVFFILRMSTYEWPSRITTPARIRPNSFCYGSSIYTVALLFTMLLSIHMSISKAINNSYTP